MREFRSSGSVEGVMGNHDSYSDFSGESAYAAQFLPVTVLCGESCYVLLLAAFALANRPSLLESLRWNRMTGFEKPHLG